MIVYINLSRDPSSRELSRNKSIINSCPLFSKAPQTYISASNANWANFYALPNVHTPYIFFRPTVSNICTASNCLAKYLATVFSPLLSANIPTVQNYITLAKIIYNLHSTNFTMISFDVKSLFANVPISGFLSCL